MIRKHENSDSWKAGGLALAVHVVLLGAMLVSFNWKAAHQVLNVTEVELWDKLPNSKPAVQVIPKPELKPIIEEKPELKPEPKPIVEEMPKPEEPKSEQPKADIELEKKKKALELKQLELIQKAEIEKQKEEEMAKKLAQKMRDEYLQVNKQAETQAKLEREKALDKLKQDMLNENNGTDTKVADNKAISAANASIIGEYTDKIKSKIRGNVNKSLCGDGNPELRFDVGLMPTGELTGTPKLIKSSGISACDAAVERAISASQPLPLPSDPALYAKFRNLNLRFKPNE